MNNEIHMVSVLFLRKTLPSYCPVFDGHLFSFYLYIYSLDLQESNGGANYTKGKQLPQPKK